MWKYYNPNPNKKNVGDCVIRAITKALDMDWYSVYSELCVQGYIMCDLPSSNAVWGQFLKNNGYTQHLLPNTCPQCYTIRDFAIDNNVGVYLVATGTHVVCVVNGDIWDSWHSENEVPIYYFSKE